MSLLKCAVVGSGMFGGNVVKAASEIGIPGIVMNASKDDIDALMLESLDNVEAFVVGDGKGTGKSRDIAKEFLLNHINIFEEEKFRTLVEDADVIFIAGSSSGGYGSGTVPTITMILSEMYTDPESGQCEKLFIPLTTLPDVNETYTAQKHSEEFLKEILGQSVPYLMYDNNNYKELPPAEGHAKVIENIKIDLQILRGDFIVPGTVDGSNMDARDLLTTISTPGLLVPGLIENLTDDMNLNGGVVSCLREQISKSAHANIEPDKVIMASAMMYNLSETILEKYGSTIAHDMQNVFGSHITDYRNEATYTGLGVQFAAVILAGLSAPNARIDQIVDLRTRQENIITSRKATTNKLSNDNTSSGLKLGVKNFGGGTSSGTPRQSVSDVMKKLQGKPVAKETK